MMIVWRGVPEWRREDGPGYQLRQYDRGRPTGMVATVLWDNHDDQTREVISGPDVWLVRERHRITVVERRGAGHGMMRLQIPLRSCRSATLLDEPGLPGEALVRLTLTVSLGSMSTVTMPLWFSCWDRPALERLARLVQVTEQPAVADPRSPQRQPQASTSTTLVPLVVDQAPDTDDWIVFGPSRSGDDAAIGRGATRPEEPRDSQRAVRRP
jgi:hypothetical protein